jgi:Methyltransferase domain
LTTQTAPIEPASSDLPSGPDVWPQPAMISPVTIQRLGVHGFPRVSPLAGIHYIDFLKRLHRKRQVERYLEIGTQRGASLACAAGRAIAIDPQFLLDKAIWTADPDLNLFEMTSDDFFSAYDPRLILGGPIDLAFIDGMHLSEFVLRDFINVERYCAKNSLIVLHDSVPQNFEMTERERRPLKRADKGLAAAWTGDVWRVLPLLHRERPDLSVQVIDCPPTGLVPVSNLDPANQTLGQRQDQLSSSLIEQEPSEAEFWSFVESVTVHDSRRML